MVHTSMGKGVDVMKRSIKSLLATLVVSLSLAAPVLAGPADNIAADAKLFCENTPTGQRYPSLNSCLEHQLGGALVVKKAIGSGYGTIAYNCLLGARYEGHTDFAAAGLCVVVKRPELAQ